MLQNSMAETAETAETGVLQLTNSSDQLTRSPNSHILQKNNNNNTLKKVKSMNCNETRTSHRGNMDQKAFNVKHNTYTTMQKNFIKASNNLKSSFEALKKYQIVSLLDKNQLQFVEPEIIVKENIENIFGITFPKLKTLLKVDHQIFIPNLNISSELEINSTSGHLKFDLAIKEAYEVVRKIFLDISKTNTKYHFFLKKIIESNEFYNLCDVREYLMKNMFNKEPTVEQLESELKLFYNNLQLKLINIVNCVDEILKDEKCTEEKQNSITTNNDFGNSETSTEIIIENFKQNMNIKLNKLEMENENLKAKETEFSKQIETLLVELESRNRKLKDTKDHLSLLMKEKNDLISMIKTIEVKEEGFYTLQNKFLLEKKKNEHLRAIIAKEYETDEYNFVNKK